MKARFPHRVLLLVPAGALAAARLSLRWACPEGVAGGGLTCALGMAGARPATHYAASAQLTARELEWLRAEAAQNCPQLEIHEYDPDDPHAAELIFLGRALLRYER